MSCRTSARAAMVSPGPVADVEARRGSERVAQWPKVERVHGAYLESTSLPPRQRRRALIANWPDKPNAASPPSHRPFDERQLSMMRDHILERKKSDKQCNQKRRYRDYLRIRLVPLHQALPRLCATCLVWGRDLQ